MEDTICRLHRLAIYALQLEIQLSRGKGWDLRYIDINKLLMLHFPVKGKYQSQTAYGFETHNDHFEYSLYRNISLLLENSVIYYSLHFDMLHSYMSIVLVYRYG